MSVQLQKCVIELAAGILLVKVVPQVLCNLDGLILGQLGGARDVQDRSAQFCMRGLLVSAARWDIIVTSTLGSTAIATASGGIVIVIVICKVASAMYIVVH